MTKNKCFLLVATMICYLVLSGALALADPEAVVSGYLLPRHKLAPLSEKDIANAQPMPLRIFDEEDRQACQESFVDRSVGEREPVFFPSYAGEDGGRASSVPEGDVTGPYLEEDPSNRGYSYPYPFTRLQVIDIDNGAYRTFPYRTIGQLYIRTPGGTGRCTASVARGRWVWTAGHCVADGGSAAYFTNFTFFPGRRKDVKPYGKWKWANGDGYGVVTLAEWYYYGRHCYDIGAVRFKKRNGKTLQQRVGSLGFSRNASRQRHWNQFGYPSDAPFNGKTLQQAQSSHAVDWRPSTCWGSDPVTIGVGNDMTPGASGGPWIFKLDRLPGATNYVNGLNSYGYSSQPGAMYGPYFGDGAQAIWNWMVAHP